MQSKTTRTTSREEQDIAQLLRYNPLRFVRESYVRFLQGLFHGAPRGWYHWELDLDDTEIVITDENPIKVDTLGKRPCISCTRAPVAFYSLGIDDMLSYDFRTGAQRKAILIPGTMSINCCSRVPLEAEQLAWVAANHLRLLRDVMRRWGFYDVGRNLAIGSPSAPGSIIQNDRGDEWYACTVTSPFQMSNISQVTPLGNKIAKSIEVALNGELHYLPPQGDVTGFAIDGSLPASDTPSIGGSVGGARGVAGIGQHSLKKVAHPLNPDVQITVRAARPGDPAVRPPAMRGRAIPIRPQPVEESPELTLPTQIVKT